MTKRIEISGKSIPGPEDIHRVELPNGIVVLCRSNMNSPSVVASGYLQAGSLFDAKEKLGLASFTSLALMRGTQQRDFQTIFNALESCGASLSFNAATHNVGFGARALPDDLKSVMGILAEVLRFPAFPSEQIEKLRAQLLTSLAIRKQDTAEMASLTFDQILFKDHPYRHPEDGWPETIQAITLDDLVIFHQQNYGPAGMVMALVGAIEVKKAIEQVQNVMADWHNPFQRKMTELPNLKPLERVESRHFKIPGKSQSDIVIGSSAPKRKDPDFLAVSLANSILGEFGLMGRIGESVREKAGLAYYAFSSFHTGLGPGSWTVSAGVNPANVERTRQLILKEIDLLIKDGVTAEELSDNQANFIGRMPLSLETNVGVANAILNIERYNLGMDYLLRYPEMVRLVSKEKIHEALKKYLNLKRLAVAVAGP